MPEAAVQSFVVKWQKSTYSRQSEMLSYEITARISLNDKRHHNPRMRRRLANQDSKFTALQNLS